MEISRRTLLAGAAAACLPLPHILPRRQTDEVIILGGGAAGLAAGKALRDQGVPFRILEARHRLGGRVLATSDFGAQVDLGAAWVRGITANPASELASQSGANVRPYDAAKTSLYRAGEQLDADTVTDFETAFGDFFAFLERDVEEGVKARTVEDLYKSFAAANKLSGQAAQGREWFVAANLEIVRGAALADLSATRWSQDESFQGLDGMPSKTFAEIFDKVGDGMNVHYGEIVLKVAAGVEKITVTTDKGAYTARDVICTLPLGVMQSGSVTFAPGFDDDRIAAMNRLRMGSLNKVALQFSEPFWPDDARRLGLLPVGDGRSTFEVWNLMPINGAPILVLQCAGPFAKRLEALSDSAIVAKAMATLKGMFGEHATEPVHAATTRWSTDPFSRGCFTHIPPGGSIEDVKAIAEQHGHIHFAGEHTSTYLGALHGAILSGRRAAQEVLA